MVTEQPVSRGAHFLKIGTLLLAVALLGYQLHHVFYGPVWRDSSVFAITAKNFIAGHGYSLSFLDEFYPYHIGISAGPVIVLPTAALMYFFGNQYWVPSLVSVILIWVLLIAVFKVTASLFNTPKERWSFCFIALSLALIFTAGGSNNFYIETGVRFSQWYLLLGTIQAGLFVILGATVLFSGAFTPKRALLGGLLLSAAILCKTIAAIAVCVCVGTLLALIFFSSAYKLLQKVALAGCALLGIGLPMLAFELWKIVTLGWPAYLDLKSSAAEYYKHAAIIISERENSGISFAPNVMKQLLTLFMMVEILTTFILVPVIAYILANTIKPLWRERVSISPQNRTSLIGLVLIGCFLAQALWWFRFSQPNSDRYMITAFMYLAGGLAFSIVRLPLTRFGKELLTLFFLIVYLESYNKVVILLYDGYRENKQLELQLGVVALLDQLKKEDVTLYSCTTTFELEHLLPEGANFKDCKQLLSHDLGDKRAALVSYYVEPKMIVVVEPKNRYYATFEELSPEILAACPGIYAKYGRAEIRWCNGATK